MKSDLIDVAMCRHAETEKAILASETGDKQDDRQRGASPDGPCCGEGGQACSASTREGPGMTTCPHCKQTIRTPRSPADHRRFFGVIRAAFHHWPENMIFTPDNETHLRKWLTAKAGYRDVVTIPVEFAEDQPAMLKLVALTVEAAVKAADGYAFIVPHNGCLAVVKAKSIAWDKLNQAQFNGIREAIEAVIESETGLKVDQLLKETEAA